MKPTKIIWYDRIEEGFKFESTGRVFRSYDNKTFDILSGDSISGGYDDVINEVELGREEKYIDECKFKPEERKEIAEYMIYKWKEWADLK